VGFVALSHPTTANKSKRMTFPRRACVRVLLKRRRARHAQAGSDPRQIAAAGGAARIRSGPVKQTNNRRNRSPDERSEIRGRSRGLHAACTPRPGFRSAHPGYEERKGGGTPADAYFQPPRPRLYPPPLAGRREEGARRASSGTRRLSAFHRGTCCSEPTPQLSSGRASWDVVGRAIPIVRKTARCSTGATRSFLSQSSELLAGRP
jgi:hypothetical protein